jgi:hypothetical protein
MGVREIYAQNFWQIGNLITGFSVTEALVMILAIGSTPWFENKVRDHRWAAMVLTAFAHIVFGSVVWWCHFTEMTLLVSQKDAQGILLDVYILTLLELVAIGAFGILLIVVIFRADRSSRPLEANAQST